MSESVLILSSAVDVSYKRRSDYPILTQEQCEFLLDVVDYIEELLDTYTGLFRGHLYSVLTADYEEIHSNVELENFLDAVNISSKCLSEIYENILKMYMYITARVKASGYTDVFTPLMRDIKNIIDLSKCALYVSPEIQVYDHDQLEVYDGYPGLETYYLTYFYKLGTAQTVVQLMKNSIFTVNDRLEVAKKTVVDRMVNDIK